MLKYKCLVLSPDSCSAPLCQGEKGEGFDVMKSGDARVALIGFPSVGKSTMLSTITKTESEQASYEFTTLTCIPGVIEYKGYWEGGWEGGEEGRKKGGGKEINWK